MGDGNEPNYDWTEFLGASYEGKRPPGEGWKTFEQIKDDMNCGVCKVRRQVKDAKAKGLLETFMGSEPNPYGILCRQIWYRPIKKTGEEKRP